MASYDDQPFHSKEEYKETPTNPNGFFYDTKSAAACSVRVAVRARPLVARELVESPSICIKCYQPENQLVIGKDRAFTFDKVFDIGTRQQDVFEICVKNLVLGCFQGFNATVLAYGQTGSGKTFTMGSGYTIGIKEQDLGIIPRVIKLIFDEVDKRKNKADIVIKCAFLEIYNEELHDLLDHQSVGSGNNNIIDRFMQKKEIQIREEKNGSISLFGLREDKVSSYEELAACLDKGSNFRSTASTLMNNCSSRSHAIFTISIEQSIIEDLYKPDAPAGGNQGDQAEEYMVAKFHFVDLAGSERAKRTGATGNTLKEGISINKGLLALGNVIAALTEEGKKNHVPYRDSKLTRILQDSLGGNSRTSMIACVSPAEINFEETLNTLKYASRARNIKNAPKVNRDPNSAQIAQLRQQVFDLQRELQSCKKVLVSNNIEFESSILQSLDISNVDVRQSTNGSRAPQQFMYGNQEIQRFEQEIKDLKQEKSQKEKRITQLLAQVDDLHQQVAQNQIDYFSVKKERDISKYNLEIVVNVLKRKGLYQEILNELQRTQQTPSSMDIDYEEKKNGGDALDNLLGISGPGILEEYQTKLEEYKKEVTDKVSQLKQIQKDYELLLESSHQDMKNLETKEQEIERLKRSVNKLQKENVQIRNESKKGGQVSKVTNNSQPTLQNFNPPYAMTRRKTIQVDKRSSSGTNKLIGPQDDSSLKINKLPLKDEKEWISKELDNNIQHFNEIFIENLSQSLSSMLVKRSATIVKRSSQDAPKSPIKEDDQENDDIPDEQINKHSSDDEDEHMVAAEDEEEHIMLELPKDEHEQQQVIESNEEVKKEDEQLRANIEQQNMLIENLEDTLKNKEDVLQTIKEQHKLLSQNLLDAMKNEYHKKIAQFQQEMQLLEQERQEQMRKADSAQQKSKLEEAYKRKLKDLEEKLSMAKVKEREQQTMQKQSSSQQQKIKSLEGEIEKMRTQKVSLMKRMKEESEQHRKWKAERVKELMQAKSANIKKDREIQMLRRENKKKDQIAKRKQEELTAMIKKAKNDKQKQINGQKQRQNKKNIDVSHLQNWIITNTEKMLRYKDLQQILQQELIQKHQVDYEIGNEQSNYASLSVRKEKLEFRKTQLEADPDLYNEEELYNINEEQNQITYEMKVIQDNLDSLEERLDFVEDKITNINKEIIEFNPDDIEQLRFEEVQSIEGARACLGAFFGILLEENIMKRELQTQLSLNEAAIESLSQQIEELKQINYANEIGFQKQIEDINQEYREKEETLIKIIMENGTSISGGDIEQLISKLNSFNPNLQLTSASGAKKGSQANSMSTTNQKLLEIQRNNQQSYVQSKTALSKRVAELERERKDEQKKLETLRHKLEQTNAEKEVIKRQLDTIRQKVKQQDIMEIKQQKVQALIDPSESNQLAGQRSPKFNPMAMANPFTKIQTLKDARNERKMKKMTGSSVNQRQPNEPRVIADEPMESDKEDGEPRVRADTSKDSRAGKSESVQVQKVEIGSSNVFARLLQAAKPKSSLIDSVGPQTSSMVMSYDTYEDDQNWKCAMSKDQAHNGQITAVASQGNQLYSTSNKSLKIWDIQTMLLVSDIQAHQGFIRCCHTWEDKRLLVTASDKSIIVWDMISLSQVGTLRGHKDEIRALAVGGPNNNLLFSAGKGTSNGGSLFIWDLRKSSLPLDEKEKNQDVFSLATTPNYLFMGCRNHTVYPINLKTFESLPHFDPPHFDAVTSLAVLQGDLLVSGSRDKNLRFWDANTLTPSFNPMQGHQDWINTLETDHDGKLMYSGSKDGVVKVWKYSHATKNFRCSAQLQHSASGQSAMSSSGHSINAICRVDKEFGTLFATGSADRQIRIWKFKEQPQSQQPHLIGNMGSDQLEDGQPVFEMVDDNIPSRSDFFEAVDDMFEFENNSSVGGSKRGSGDQQSQQQQQQQQVLQQYQHSNSQKYEDFKQGEIQTQPQKGRPLTRTSSQLMTGVLTLNQGAAGSGVGGGSSARNSAAASSTKLEQKRKERRMMINSKRSGGGGQYNQRDSSENSNNQM